MTYQIGISGAHRINIANSSFAQRLVRIPKPLVRYYVTHQDVILLPSEYLKASNCQASRTLLLLFQSNLANSFLHIVVARTAWDLSFIDLFLKPCDFLQTLRIPDHVFQPLLLLLR